jgi:molecular chaperone DnaJ
MNGREQRRDLYELLGVRPDAPAAEITRAYHRRARALHPDAQAGEPARFRELREAYGVLGDPARRAAYDQALRPPASWPAPAAGATAAGWPDGGPPGAALWAGPVQVIPPPGAAGAGDRADAALAVLAMLLARRLGARPGWDWPW